MTKLKFLLPILFLSSIACESTRDPTLTTIRSEPTGAYVEVDYTKQSCTTPCTIKLERPLRIHISKEGFEKQSFYIKPGSRDVIVKLELIADSADVESTQLPDL